MDDLDEEGKRRRAWLCCSTFALALANAASIRASPRCVSPPSASSDISPRRIEANRDGLPMSEGVRSSSSWCCCS